MGAPIPKENGQDAGDDGLTESRISPGHCGPGKQDAQELMVWGKDTTY